MNDLKSQVEQHLISATGRINPNLYKESWWGRRNLSDLRNRVLEFTSFLPSDIPWNRRIWHVINECECIPNCKLEQCNSPVKFIDGKYQTYCSLKCNNNDPNVLVARKSTMIDKYGAPTTLQSEVLSKKVKSTNIERYGVDNPLKSEEVKERVKKTNIERHGVDNPLKSSDIRERRDKTSIDRYGAAYTLASPVLREKVSKTNIERYGVDNVNKRYIPDGVDDLLGDHDWLCEKSQNITASELSDFLGISKTKLYTSIRGQGIRFASGVSEFENKCVDFLNDHSSNLKVKNRDIIPPLELDIYLPDHKIAIECNGSYYHSERDKGNAKGKDRHYHLNKTKLCEEQGIQLIHIWEHDWNRNPELIKRRLLSKLGLNERIFARKTQVAKLITQISAEFLNQHHLQGTCPASVKYGLYEQNDLVAVMTLGKSRFSKNYEWELLRYCSTKQVIGGASKLFKHFQRECQPKSVVSYSDKMWNTGNLYKQLGFEHSHVSKPSYYYTKNYLDFENRVAYQKHKLHNKLEHFDPNKSEWENMQANGFDRIWDCGSDVWVFTKS